MAENIQDQIEDKIIDCINSGVAGRLIIFKPEKNNFGADLAIERRGKYKEKEIFFKISSIAGPAEGKDFIKDFLQDDFKADKNFYLIFVYFDEVKQKISDYIWLLPSLQFRDMADATKSSENENLLRFEASLNNKDKNKYSKFLVEVKELGKLILGALEAKGKIDFKDAGFQEKRTINLESLKEFLCEARRNIYAANATPVDNPRLLASKQLEFQKGEYSYRDIYFSGDNGFIGQEVVYQNSKPVWGMNYIESKISKLDTNFLKESLLKLSQKCRLGQICEYEKRELKYQDNGQGTFEDFFGQEEIFSEGKSVYKLNYQGRLIAKEL